MSRGLGCYTEIRYTWLLIKKDKGDEMPAFPAILIGLLVSPSTWILAVVFLIYSPSSVTSSEPKYIIAWLLVVGITLHAIRELAKDLPWLGRSTPPPGLHCTPSEWNSQFEGKPLFAVHLLSLTVIRALTLFLLFSWIVRK